ncbi:MAG: DUF4833 domain-containing protein [Bacteroidales bacterium]|nr:DUF4833 domain-containing protein [Bacteroidales bacterium]
MMNYHLLTGILLFINLYATQAQSYYPLPPKTDKMLFYLQRSFNTNTIIFEAEFSADNILNSERPVKMYWKGMKRMAVLRNCLLFSGRFLTEMYFDG